MTDGDFWRLIEESRLEADHALSNQSAILLDKLRSLPADEIRSFQEHFVRFWQSAYRSDLWAAAHIIERGCSDDGFMDFRSGLIGLGRTVFFAALEDPESLALLPRRTDFSQEALLYAASDAFESVTGQSMPPIDTSEPRELELPRFDEDILAKLFPRLARRFMRDNRP